MVELSKQDFEVLNKIAIEQGSPNWIKYKRKRNLPTCYKQFAQIERAVFLSREAECSRCEKEIEKQAKYLQYVLDTTGANQSYRDMVQFGINELTKLKKRLREEKTK